MPQVPSREGHRAGYGTAATSLRPCVLRGACALSSSLLRSKGKQCKGSGKVKHVGRFYLSKYLSAFFWSIHLALVVTAA